MLSREGAAKGLPRNEDVMLRIFNLADKRVTVLAKLIGGQGTIDGPSWAPDGRRLAFVSYQLLPKK
jgi:Tol biopolymer transport system component